MLEPLIKIAILTGGLRYPLCHPENIGVLLDALATTVIETTPVTCDIAIPEPEGGEPLDPDTLEVEYESELGAIEVFHQVPGLAACEPAAFWVDATDIHLCPDACGLVQADDAAALIAALGDGPAYVFGTSGGAQIGLALAVRHPAKVRTLVAHEPPAIMLLDDPSAQLAADKDIHDTYRREGVDAAMAKFFGMNDLDAGPGPGGEAAGEVPDDADGPPGSGMPPEATETFARVSGNFEYWLAHGMLPLWLYTPDVETLKAGTPRIVVAIGEASAGQPFEEMSLALTNKLGIAPTKFPGDHMGFGPQAAAFAEALHNSFTN